MEILVPTSNRYIHCLPGFAYLFNKYWSDKRHVTVLCYDEKPENLPENFTVLQLGKQNEFTWSSGLAAGINLVVTGPFVLMLEDYFLDRPVNSNSIDMLYKHIEETERVVKIDLTKDRLKAPHIPYSAIPDGILSDYNSLYQASTQAAIWKKEFILKFFDPTEGPWEWEKSGTRRIIRARCEGWKGDILGTTSPPMHYINAIGGEGNHPYKWAKNRFPNQLWEELKEKEFV